MKRKHFLALLLTAGIAVANAAPPPKPPQDVNVVNTPNVTVKNPQTSVTVDNTAPIPVSVQDGITIQSEPRFVGFSTDSVQGDAGLVGMHGACATTYGEGARMCLDIEVIKTPNPQPTPSVAGWIQATKAYFSGYGADCHGWSTAAEINTESILRGDRLQLGSFNSPVSYHCNDLRPVACCK
jgi:hypothetical protein